MAAGRAKGCGLEFGSPQRTKCPGPVQASTRVAGGRPQVPSKNRFKREPETWEGDAAPRPCELTPDPPQPI